MPVTILISNDKRCWICGVVLVIQTSENYYYFFNVIKECYMLKWLDSIYEKIENVLIFVRNSICNMMEFFMTTLLKWIVICLKCIGQGWKRIVKAVFLKLIFQGMKFKHCKFKYLVSGMEVNALSMKNVVTQIISTVNYSNIHIWNFNAIYVIN